MSFSIIPFVQLQEWLLSSWRHQVMAALKLERSMFEDMPYDGIVGLGLGGSAPWGWVMGGDSVGFGMVRQEGLLDIHPP